jgi:hypothetical protein
MIEPQKKLEITIKKIPSQTIEKLRTLLLKKWAQSKKTTAIFPNPGIKKYPGIYFWGIITKDWSGLIGATTSIVTESGWDIASCWALAIVYQREKLGVIIIGVKIKEEKTINRFMKEKEKLREKLYNVCSRWQSKQKLLIQEAKRMERCEEVIKLLKEEKKFTEGVEREVSRFFDTIEEWFIEERGNKFLSEIILTNYKFIQNVRKTGGKLQLKVKKCSVKKHKFTEIILGLYEKDFSLPLLLSTINEVSKDYTINYHCKFVTDDGILIYRLEISPPLPIKRLFTEISNTFNYKKISKSNVPSEILPTLETYTKVIIPKLIREYKVSGVRQLYISSEIISKEFVHLRLIIVKEIQEEEWLTKFISQLSLLKGITIIGCETPKIIQEIEITPLEIKIELPVIKNGREVYSKIRDILSNIIGEVRDFTEGMRKYDLEKFNYVRKRIKGIDTYLLRKIYFEIEDFYRNVSTEEEILETVKLGIKLTKENKEVIKIKVLNENEVIVGIRSKRELMSNIIKSLPPYEMVVSKIHIGNNIIFLLSLKNEEKINLSPLKVSLSNALKIEEILVL